MASNSLAPISQKELQKLDEMGAIYDEMLLDGLTSLGGELASAAVMLRNERIKQHELADTLSWLMLAIQIWVVTQGDPERFAELTKSNFGKLKAQAEERGVASFLQEPEADW